MKKLVIITLLAVVALAVALPAPLLNFLTNSKRTPSPLAQVGGEKSSANGLGCGCRRHHNGRDGQESATAATAQQTTIVEATEEILGDLLELIMSLMTTAAGSPPAGSPPVGSPPVGSPPAGSPPAGSPPAGAPPAGAPPAGQ